MIGRAISHYKVLERLGGGGMGVVYKARDLRLDRIVALKFLPPHLGDDEDVKQRFIQEARAASALDHPNICTIHEVGEAEDGRMFICMAYYEGETLKKKIERGALPVEETVTFARQMAEGLAKAHEQGIIHRDIKPANVMVTGDGVVKIVDFGLAKVAHINLTKIGTTMGTTAYMSPEQARGEEVDHRTDIWSFGVVLYQMLTGELPFKGDYEQAVIYAILNEDPPFIDNVSPNIAHLADKCLRKEKENRYQKFQEIIDEFRTVDGNSKLSAPTSFLKKGEHNRIKFLLPIGFVVLAVLAFIFFYPSWSAEERTIGKSIAVLPFDNLSSDKNNAYFASGIQDEILTKLANLGDLKVISRTSTQQYKSHPEDLRVIGKQLGVATVLEGSVQRADNQIRVNVQLINTVTGSHIWAGTYDRELKNVFEVESEVAEKIAQTLKAKLTPEQALAVASSVTEDPQAYDLFLRGEYVRRMVEVNGYWEKTPEAVRFYKQAIAKDPGFALAFSRLSYIEIFKYWFIHDDPDLLTEAKRAAEEALRLKPDLSEAHLTMGYYHYWGHLEYDEAVEQFNEVLDTSPNNVEALSALGYVYRKLGQWEDAVTYQKKSVALDPRNSLLIQELATTYWVTGRLNLARQSFDRALAVDPGNGLAKENLARLFVFRSGNVEQGIKLLEGTKQWYSQLELADLYSLIREYKRSQLIFDSLLQATKDTTDILDVSNVVIQRGILHQHQGKKGEAIPTLRKAQKRLVEQSENRSRSVIVQSDISANLGLVNALLSEKESAIRAGRKALSILPFKKDHFDEGPQHLLNLAQIYALLGDAANAVPVLQRLLEIPQMEISVQFLRLDPLWDRIRKDPGFKELLENYSDG